MKIGLCRGLKVGVGVVAGFAGGPGFAATAPEFSGKIEWRLSAPMPDARAGYAAGAVGGRLIVVGGTYWLGQPGAWTQKIFCATTDAFDPGAGTWERLPDAPVDLAYAAGAVVDDRLYVLGGVQAGQPSRRVLVLEKKSGVFRWRDGPPLPEARVFAEAAVVQGRIYVAGGSSEFETMDGTGLCCTSNTATTTLWSWDPGDPAAAWKQHASFPGHRRWTPRVVSNGRYLYQFGGRFLTGKDQPVRYFNEVWRYDIQADEWTMIAAMPEEIQLARAVSVGGMIVLVGRDKRSMVFDPASGAFAGVQGLPEDALVDFFAWIPPYLAGSGGETRLERPRRRADWTFLGKFTPGQMIVGGQPDHPARPDRDGGALE